VTIQIPAGRRGYALSSLSAATLVFSAQCATAQTASTESEIAALRAALRQQQQLTRQLMHRLDALTAAQSSNRAPAAHLASGQPVHKPGETALASPPIVPTPSSTPATTPPAASVPLIAVDAGYQNGFYIKDPSGDNALYINGLLQPRFKFFQPFGTGKIGGKDQASNNFDDFLARLYFSGNVVDPSLTYFITLQGTTQGSPTAAGITLLDAEVAKSFSPLLKVEMGRYWSAYTYEYYDDIGKYLLPDLSAAEWAFSLGRQIGVRASGKTGDLTYNLSLSNPIPGSLSGGTENPTTKLAVIGNVSYDILAPYGYMETDPSLGGAAKPELTLWASAMYNPVQNGNVIYNDVRGDDTEGATVSLNFRTGYFTFQGSFYYKHNDARGPNAYGSAHGAFDSYGWQEQAGYYVVPSKFELVERVDGLTWGFGQNGPAVAADNSDTQWYAGPDNFGYHRMTEFTGGLNYYLHGHNAKLQAAYSYMKGSTFSHQDFGANRLIIQTQLAF
jgi:hypothetical protein